MGLLPGLPCQQIGLAGLAGLAGLTGLSGLTGTTPMEQHGQQLGHAAVAAAVASMGMESSELVAVAHYQAQQLQRQLLAEQQPGPIAMLPAQPPSAQPTGGGSTQPLQHGQQGQQPQGQDPLQSLVQQLLCLQQIEYFLAQRGHK